MTMRRGEDDNRNHLCRSHHRCRSHLSPPLPFSPLTTSAVLTTAVILGLDPRILPKSHFYLNSDRACFAIKALS